MTCYYKLKTNEEPFIGALMHKMLEYIPPEVLPGCFVSKFLIISKDCYVLLTYFMKYPRQENARKLPTQSNKTQNG